MDFVHLHVHTYYSILDGESSIKSLFKMADKYNQSALAITDHGNMFGVKDFLKVAEKFPNIKPIIGCEVYVNPEGRFTKRGREDQGAYHLILLAKNLEGYYNLVKIVSTGWVEGLYYKPKVDREILERYHSNIICSSACLGGEIPSLIRKGDLKGAEEAALWYKNLFGEDYYLEVQLHKTEVPGMSLDTYEKQLIVNKEIFSLSERLGIKCIATNDVHFASKEDGPAHDRLICLTTNALLSDTKRMRYTQQEYLKSAEEMAALFPEHPEVLANTLEVAQKVERYTIDRGHVLPKFELPQEFLSDIESYREEYKEIIEAGKNERDGSYRGDEFVNSVAYLCKLSYDGAKSRYGTLTPAIMERIEFELKTICNMGFPDYFLIVQDFIAAARKMGVSVGPGRGSAAGSVVAYCLGITQLDPIKYDLLFERFLNPERISMPDIDIDFDDEGRGAVLRYVEEKYGKDHVSHVVTFGTMATKSAIKDVARIQNVPIEESNRLTKLVPDKFPPKVEEKVDENGVKRVEEKKVEVNIANCIELVPELKEAYEHSLVPGVRETLQYAKMLEGTVRQTGVHACAIIIGRDNLMEHIPISIAKDKETGENMWVSQYEGSFIEEVGMLKMDFLGLRTLSIIKEALKNIKRHRGKEVDIDHIPLDDKKTYELFGRGDTIATFQFESPGMQKWLRELKPTKIDDIIAMNALYRPGPMDYIPDFVDRKMGRKKIEYDLPQMEEILKDTYGVTVYQEQVMLLSQKLAGFSKGKADKLRKAMGKKKIDVMEGLFQDYLKGGMENGHPKEVLEKIWKDWTAFASYAFNKSHAACYSWVAYQTAYLKAHYPAEFMAANLSKNLSNIDELTKLMDDCKHLGIKVLGPDINESESSFAVNSQGNIRYGMAGIKGVGAAISEAIVTCRGNRPFESPFDFIERASAVGVTRKVVESLVYAGAFDSFGTIRRDQFFMTNSKGEIFLDALCRYGTKMAADAQVAASSLFGDDDITFKPVLPEVPVPGEYNRMEFLKKEKEMVGIYLSDHPLSTYKFEIENFTTRNSLTTGTIESEAEENPQLRNKPIYIAGLVGSVERKVSKNGKPYISFTIEDFEGSTSFKLFGKDYDRFNSFIVPNEPLFIKLEAALRFVKKEENADTPAQEKCEVRIKQIMHLANTKENFIKSFTIDIDVKQLTPDLRKSLVKEIKHNKGKKLLNIKLIDKQEQLTALLFSKKQSIDVNADFLDYLDRNNLSYSTETQINL